MNTFNDSYDEFYCKLRETMDCCKENEKLFDFLVDSSKRVLNDLQKKVDKKALDKITKGQVL